MANFSAVLHVFLDTFRESLFITAFVLFVMSIAELLNYSSLRTKIDKLKSKPVAEVAVACLLGAVPGCAGGLTVVSLFSQDVLSFGAFIGGMISTYGDEALFLIAKSPKYALLISTILLVLGFCVGFIITKINIPKKFYQSNNKHISANCLHSADFNKLTSFKEKSGYFLKHTVWNHVVKEHALQVFLCVFITMFLIEIVELYVSLETIFSGYAWAKWLLLIFAIIVGFLPVSGPHLAFLVLFLQGIIPFGIVIANSIVQNGHSGLPMLSFSRRGFFAMKIINALVAMAVGVLMLL